MTSRSERRSSRSENPAEALGLFLSSIARRTEAEAVVVADARGHLVAGTGAPRETLRDLAATCCLSREELQALDTHPARFFGQPFTLEGETYVLGARGGHPASASEVAGTVARILG